MSIFKRILLTTLMLAGVFSVSSASISAQGALFNGAKGEACKGANLSNDISDCKSDEAATKVEGTLEKIINLLTLIVGIVAVILIILSGLRFITANGDSNSIQSARNGIIYALVGLIIVALAQAIVRFIIVRANN